MGQVLRIGVSTGSCEDAKGPGLDLKGSGTLTPSPLVLCELQHPGLPNWNRLRCPLTQPQETEARGFILFTTGT